MSQLRPMICLAKLMFWMQFSGYVRPLKILNEKQSRTVSLNAAFHSDNTTQKSQTEIEEQDLAPLMEALRSGAASSESYVSIDEHTSKEETSLQIDEIITHLNTFADNQEGEEDEEHCGKSSTQVEQITSKVVLSHLESLLNFYMIKSDPSGMEAVMKLKVNLDKKSEEKSLEKNY